MEAALETGLPFRAVVADIFYGEHAGSGRRSKGKVILMKHEENDGKAEREDGEMRLVDVEVHSPNREDREQDEMHLADVTVSAPDGENGTSGSPVEPPARRLTAREIEVLNLIAQGRTNRQIAKSLTISPGTVRVHVQHIIAKLEVSDRTEAAVRASELGLLSPSS